MIRLSLASQLRLAMLVVLLQVPKDIYSSTVLECNFKVFVLKYLHFLLLYTCSIRAKATYFCLSLCLAQEQSVWACNDGQFQVAGVVNTVTSCSISSINSLWPPHCLWTSNNICCCSLSSDLGLERWTMFIAHKDINRGVFCQRGRLVPEMCSVGKRDGLLVRCSSELSKVTSWNPSARQYWAIQGSICSLPHHPGRRSSSVSSFSPSIQRNITTLQ